MIPVSYTTALLNVLKDNLEATFNDAGVTIDLGDYGESFPAAGNMSGSIGIEITPVAQPISLGDCKRLYSVTIEIKLASNQHFGIVNQIYDIREFLLNHLLHTVRKDGVNGIYSGVQVHQGLLGFDIKRSPTYIDSKQDNLSYARTIISLEWSKVI
jgi:hypothetical protein